MILFDVFIDMHSMKHLTQKKQNMRWCLVTLLVFSTALFQNAQCLVVRLASWNLLAQCYAKPTKYPWCNPSHLEWEYRKSLIVPKILEMDADVICLQEVQVDLWPELMDTFRSHQYTGVLQNVTRGHNVASAILIRDSSCFEFKRLESRSRVLIGVLQDKRSKNDKTKKMYLCNVHLEAGEKDGDNLQRYHQLKSLFKRLTNQVHRDQIPVEDASIIIAGDFNMLRKSPLHTFLSQGLLQSPEQIKNLPPASTIKLFDAYLDPQRTPADSTLQPIPSKLCYDDNHCNQGLTERKPLERTYAFGEVLDYCWHSRALRIRDTLLFHPLASTKLPQKWPSDNHPSDHLPIGVDFEWE